MVRFNAQDAMHIFEKLKLTYGEACVDEWKEKVTQDLNCLFDKYEIREYELNKNSYMGIVLDCSSKKEALVIKVVPPMIRRFSYEVETICRLSPQVTCHIYEVDREKNAIIMERVLPGDRAILAEYTEDYRRLFWKLYSSRIMVDDYIKGNFLTFRSVVERDYELYRKNGKQCKYAEALFVNFQESYEKIERGREMYLLHGDVYRNNVLVSGDGLRVIDPLGFVAPFVMELVSSCAYDIFFGCNAKEVLKKYVEIFEDYVDGETYKEALFCQLVKVYIPSVFEANDGGERAEKWLKIIEELYPERMMV